jgi:hypothetical protein
MPTLLEAKTPVHLDSFGSYSRTGSGRVYHVRFVSNKIQELLRGVTQFLYIRTVMETVTETMMAQKKYRIQEMHACELLRRAIRSFLQFI